MIVKTETIRGKDQLTTTWSGGTTTQLAIYPPEASYASRLFKWRLSSAIVSVPESSFTALPGFKRILMILSGTMTLKHEKQYEKELGPFDQDNFDGDWTTTSIGKATDFNLMMRDGVKGSVEALIIEPQKALKLIGQKHTESETYRTEAFYLVDGQLEIVTVGQTVMLEAKDIFLTHETPPFQDNIVILRQNGSKPVSVIHASINY